MGVKEFNEGLDELERTANAGDGLTRSLSVVSGTNPEEEARQEELSRRTGIPAPWVPEFKDDAARRDLLSSPVVRELPRTAPKTTAWLSRPENARLAHDDIETLAGIEGVVDMMGRGVDLGGVPTAFGRGLRSSASDLSAGLAETGDILFTPFLREGAKLTGSELLRDLARAPRIASEYWRKEADRISGEWKPGTAAFYANQIGRSVGSSVLSMPFGIAGQGPALAMFGLGSEGGYRKYTDAGYNETYAALLALSSKAMEGITEKMGLDVFYNPEKIAKPVFRVALEFLVGELAGEELNTAWEAAKDKLTLEPNLSLEDVAARVVDTAIVTVGAAGAQGVAGSLAARAADRLEGSAAASRNRRLMEALGEAAQESKLLKRLPEKAREFVEHVTADGPVTDVAVPVEEWTTYFQGKGLDPAEAAEAVLGSPAPYQEALATGSDLTIPLGRYVEKLAGTEHHAGLAQDLRLRQGEMTAREEDLFRQGLSSRIAELADPGVVEETPQGSDRKVYEDVFAQLTAAGKAPVEAAREAALWQARYRTRAQRLGVDPHELYRERKVTITAQSSEGTPEGATLSQKAPPLIQLTGKELDPYIEKDDRVAAARAFYREHLKGNPVNRPNVGTIEFNDVGWSKLRQGKFLDDLRFAALPSIRAILESGEYLGRKENTKTLEGDTGKKKRFVAFHGFAGNVSIGGQIYKFGVTVGEDAKGKLFYNLSRNIKEEGPGGDSVFKDRVPGPQGSSDATLEKSVLPADDGVNLILLPQEGETDRRGFIRIGASGEVEIGLLEKADRSTFLHETGHAWLEELAADASRADAPEQLRDDFTKIAAWVGITGLVQDAGLRGERVLIPESAHEQFARGVEAYLMEGKSPSAELASAFARFKAWLVQVYREISRLRVTLTPEVRGVLDRLVATDEEIEAAEGKLHLAPLFATAEAAGMTQDEFALYRAADEKARATNRERLSREVMEEHSREATAVWKEDRERVRAVVEKEANREPVFQVYHLLTRGELPDGSTPAQPIRLSRKAFIDAYGQEFVEKLPPKWFKKMTAEDGMHPDLVAEMFGFRSGSEMIQRLQDAPHREAWVEEETDRRMKELHGDLLVDGSILEAATDAVHNDDTARKLREELRAIRRKERATRAQEAKDRGEVLSDAQQRDLRLAMEASIPPIAAFREAAARTIRNKSAMSLRPDLYLRAEQKAGKKAFDAAAKDQWDKAAAEKKKQLLNHYLYLEARKGQAEVDSIYRYVKSLLASTGQERLGKAGGDYLAQINGLLEQYEFRQVTTREIEERKSLVEWAQEQEAAGLEPDIPPVILYNARQVNYRELKLHQLESLRDALRNIEHLARLQGRLLGAHAAVSFNEAASGLITALHENVGSGKKIPIDRETRTSIERAGDRLTQFHVALMKAEQFIEWADGRDIGGPWNTYIFQPIADAQALEGDLTMRYTKQLAELFEGYARQLGGFKAMKTRVPIKILGEPLTRQGIIAAALNTGNEGNLDKLLGGRGWSEDQLQEVLSHLDRKDWVFVQDVWDAIEGMWPSIAALQKRMTGLEPKKVQRREFTVTLKDGTSVTLRGGYYPAVYDADVSAAGAKQVDAQGNNLFEGVYVRAATEKGYTERRTAYRGPVLLSLEVIPQHFATVVHDLTHREAIVQAWRLLQNPAVRETVSETMGVPYYRMLNLWLASVATDRQAPPTGTEALNRFVDRLRMNATIVAMGFKVTTVVAQALDIAQSLRRVKGRYLGRALSRFVRNPAEARRFVQEKSGEMRHRERNLDRDLRDLGRQLVGKEGVLPAVQKAAMRGIAIVDMAASVPTWLGAYEQALASGMTEADAIHWADRTVRLSNPAGGAKDLAAVQRKESFWKLFTMFYSYFNVMYNAQADEARSAVRMARGEKAISPRDPLAGTPYGGGDLAIGALAMWIIPALAGELLAGRGPDDDEEAWQWLLRKLAVFPFLSLPGIRDIANAVESGREYQMTPVAGAFAAAARTARRVGQVAEDEREPEDLLLPVVDLVGYSVGLPTGQAKITGRYAWDLMQGETPDSAAEFLRNVMFYRKRK